MYKNKQIHSYSDSDRSMTTNKRKVGGYYEDLAAAYLKKKGYVILEQNFTCRQGEIDLIVRDGNTYVFVEVKYRRNLSSGYPEEAVGNAKQRTICRAALYYLKKYVRSVDVPCRFDVTTVLGNGKIHHIPNAFPYEGRW